MTSRDFSKTAYSVILVLILLIQPLSAQRTKSSLSAGNQRHSEKSLKDHNYFFYFINPTVSNTGTDEEKNLFIEAVRRDIIARTLYMKFSFNPAMNEIIIVQNLLINLFQKICVRETENATALLNEIAPEILHSENKRAKKYMSLGYRSVDSAKKVKMMTDNVRETNYSIRLYEYVKAIKSAKYARRLAIIALLEKRIPAEKKKKINYNRYEKVKELLELYGAEKRDKMLPIHFDNYYKTTPATSLYDSIIANPELEKIPEYQNYKKEI